MSDILDTLFKAMKREIIGKKYRGKKKKTALKTIESGGIPLGTAAAIYAMARTFDVNVETEDCLFIGILLNTAWITLKNFIKQRR